MIPQASRERMAAGAAAGGARGALGVGLPLAARATRLTAAIAAVQAGTEDPETLDTVERLAADLCARIDVVAEVHRIGLGTRPSLGLVRAQAQRALDALDALLDERLRGHGALDAETDAWVRGAVAPLRAALRRLDDLARLLPEVRL